MTDLNLIQSCTMMRDELAPTIQHEEDSTARMLIPINKDKVSRWATGHESLQGMLLAGTSRLRHSFPTVPKISRRSQF